MTFLPTLRLIKEEKQNTELRAEELENRVNNLDLQHSPQNSGRSTPSQAKSDLYKISLAKSNDKYKCLTVFNFNINLFSLVL
jgi:hypothetical protein